MNDAPKGVRLHIGIFGRRNVGKSSLLNTLTGQDVAIVSPTAGTTTDPVEKTLEFAPLGPVVFHDTAGIDDVGDLGAQRTRRSLSVLPGVDMAVVVTEPGMWGAHEEDVSRRLGEADIPFVVAVNKSDTAQAADLCFLPENVQGIPVSARLGEGMAQLREAIVSLAPQAQQAPPLVADLLPEAGVVILVVPLDSGAPKGRLILPQVQTIRDSLDNRKLALVCTEKDLPQALGALKEPPAIVVCDSQVVHEVARLTPISIPLTTFSILMARHKGDLPLLAAGAAAIGQLAPDSRVLMLEACSHHPQKDDIGRIKIPRLLQKFTGHPLQFDMRAGKRLDGMDKVYALAIHCGGCTLTHRQMCQRLAEAQAMGIPMTNYGVAISCAQGVLERVLSPFPEALSAYLAAREQGRHG